METFKSNTSLLLLVTLFLSTIVSQINGGGIKTQSEALSQLYKAKLKQNSNIDRSHFDANLDDLQYLHTASKKTVVSQEGLKENDKIQKLPGQPPVKFEQYGGYVTVDESAGRAFYYYFVEAQHSKESLPLLLWLNGGPGCSSLAYGAFQELGPFRVNSDGKTLHKNNFAWNHAANVLFVESPAGVGFSYSNTSTDVKVGGDRKTANDNYRFLINWLEKFPEYKDRDFYISGESYAGHYVPQLAHTILYHNKKAKKNIINLKGILIGNAVINDETDTRGMYEYFASHALISDEVEAEIQKECKFTVPESEESDKCQVALGIAEYGTHPLDIYAIYAPRCHNSNLTSHPKKPSLVIDPCSDDYTTAYMNRPDVQKALHANVTNIKYATWQPCSDVLTNWTDSPSTVIPLLREFMANDIRVWIFSGDTDGRVPVTSTKKSIKIMNLPTKTPWHPWFLNEEVGGYTQVYKGDMTFVTVRGAGHQVPAYEAARALSLIMHFLAGTDLPDLKRYNY
ncbi:serine carboxypeptidase-like 40 isoform X1 [Lycium barbarum]|uniref:serine carboxypeptidase-like 40 isoform X1 n=1 Tax=Lycium barbarum TaxID=112863 RepID=UPI00293F419A|nr:serine carboxypeptidase-like 40 isoform X1 [Lycium barbarum]